MVSQYETRLKLRNYFAYLVKKKGLRLKHF